MAETSERRSSPCGEDLALVRGVLGGDRSRLDLLAERLCCIPRILQVLNLRGGRQLGPEELDDLAQDVLVVAWRKLNEYEGLASLEGWAYGISVLEYQNAVRRRRRLLQEAQVIARRGERLDDAAHDPDPWAFEDVHEGLLRIGRDEARIIRLKHFEGRTFEEIASALELSPNTVKARYYRGIEELRPLLGARCGPTLGPLLEDEA